MISKWENQFELYNLLRISFIPVRVLHQNQWFPEYKNWQEHRRTNGSEVKKGIPIYSVTWAAKLKTSSIIMHLTGLPLHLANPLTTSGSETLDLSSSWCSGVASQLHWPDSAWTWDGLALAMGRWECVVGVLVLILELIEHILIRPVS